MALTKQQKADQLDELKESMKKSQSVIFTHYSGLTVSDVSKLRANLRKENAEMKVAKKTLMQLAAKDLGWPEIPDTALDGPVACIFSFVDALSGAQVAFKFSKKSPQVELVGGIYEGKLISKQEAMTLAQIPSKLQLLGMFAAMCNGPLTSFARGLSEIAKQKEAPASAKATADVPPAAAPEAPKAEAAPEAPAPAAPEAPAAAPEASAAPTTETPAS